MPASPADLFALFDRLGIATETVEHEPLFTVEQSRWLYEELDGGHAKNLFLVDRKGRRFLVIAEKDTEIDLKRLHRLIGASGRLSFGKPERLMALLGVEPGSVTPFGLMNDAGREVSVILDERLMAHAHVNFHPLTNARTTRLASADLLRFLAATGHTPRVMSLDAPAPEAA
jgi:Ala-tRNA(Pro) deacylase